MDTDTANTPAAPSLFTGLVGMLMPCRGAPAPAAPLPVDGVPLVAVLFRELLLPASDRFVFIMPVLTLPPRDMSVDPVVGFRATTDDDVARPPPEPAPATDRPSVLLVLTNDVVMERSALPPPPLPAWPRRPSVGVAWELSSHG